MDKILSNYYAQEFNIPYELACILSSRFPSYEDAKKFLYPELGQLHAPEGIPDIETATTDIVRGIDQGENILIYAHDDPDGFCSAKILYYTLSDIRRKGKPEIYLYPINREKDGYVLNSNVLKEYKNRGVKILITVDFGISNAENFEVARNTGLKLVICDHHETNLTQFPVPAIDPKRPDSKYPFRELAGVGVTLKLCQSLYKKMFGLDGDEFLKLKSEFLAITMVGTIADRVMALNENRVLCHEGLKALRKMDKPWVKWFLAGGNISFPGIFSEIIPILQAASLEDSNLGIEFFLTESDEKFTSIAEKLRGSENDRKSHIDSLFQIALDVAKVYPTFVISIFPDHVTSPLKSAKINNLGRIASRLRDHFQRTAIAIMTRENKCIGELRSHDINLFDFLNNTKHLFLDFGGHKRAAGFSMTDENIDDILKKCKKNIPAFIYPEK